MNEVAIYLLKSAGILSLFWLVYQILLAKETFFTANRLYFIVGIAIAFILPALEYQKVIWIEETTNVNSNFFIVAGSQTNKETSINIWDILYGIYSLGVLISIFKIIISFFSIFKMITKGNKRYHNGIYFIENATVENPFSFFNYIIYNPTVYDKKELSYIIKHELAHLKQRHSIDVLLINMCCVVLWFFPPVYYYKKQMLQNLEYLADTKATKSIKNIKHYQYLLIKNNISTPNNQVLVNTFFQSSIKKRIVMLQKSKSKKQNIWKLGTILPLLAIFFMSFQVKTVAQVKEKKVEIIEVVEQPTPQKKKEIIEVIEQPKTTPQKEVIELIEKPSTPTTKEKEIIAFPKTIEKTEAVVQSNTSSKKEKIEVIEVINDTKPKSTINTKDKSKTKKYTTFSFDKSTSDETFKFATSEFKKIGVSLNFKNIKRNQNGEIIAIKSTYQLNDNSGKYSVNGTEAINSFAFTAYYDDNSKIISAEYLTMDDKKLDHENLSNVLYVVDGKIKDKAFIETIKPNNIEKVNVIKGDAAIKKYGDKATNGVIEIYTKK